MTTFTKAVDLASVGETEAGVIDSKAVTPAGLSTLYSQVRELEQVVVGEATALTTSSALSTLFNAESGGTNDTYFGAYVWCELADGTLFAGIGNRPADNDGALIVKITTAGVVTLEKKLDEQGVHEMRLHDGKLYVLGTDAALGDDWTYGNVYVRSAAGVWTKRRTLPNVLHVLSQCWTATTAGTWYVGTGAHTGDNSTWMGYVYKSADDGATWTKLTAEVTDYRVYNLSYFRSRLYAGGMTQAQYAANAANIYTSIDDGETWVDSAQTIRARPRWIEFGGNIVAAGLAGTTIVIIDAAGAITEPSLPFTLNLANYEVNVFASDGTNLFAIGTTKVWSTTDLVTWVEVATVANSVGIGYWANQDAVLVCSKGTTAAVSTTSAVRVHRTVAADLTHHKTDLGAHANVITAHNIVAGAHSGLFTTHNADAAAHSGLLTTHNADAAAHSGLLTTHNADAAAHSGLLSTHNSDFNAHVELLTTYYDKSGVVGRKQMRQALVQNGLTKLPWTVGKSKIGGTDYIIAGA